MATEKIFFAIEVDSGKAIPELASIQKAITAAKKSQAALNKEFKAGTLDENAFAKATSANRIALKSLNSEYNKGAKAAAGLTKKTSGLSKAFNKVGIQIAGAFAARAVFNAIGDTIGIIKDFEQAAADVASVLGKTTEETIKLQNAAQDLGATTIFTATEVQGLQKELAKLGFTEQQILSAQEAILQLAAATNTDLARAAEVAASTVRSLGLTASDTQEVVDVMVKSFSSSGLDLERFAESMKLVAPTARATGRDLQDVTTMLGVMADNGISGSLAGTQLSRVFIELNKKGLTLEEALSKVTKSQNKLSAATDLVGDRGAKALLIFAENSGALETLEGKLRDAGGAAETMANTQLNTLNGQVKLLNSAWAGFILSLEKGDGVLAGVLKGSVSLLAEALGMFTDKGTLEERLAKVGENTNMARLASDMEDVAFLTKKLTEAGKEENEARARSVELVIQQLEGLKESQNLWGDEVEAIDERVRALREANAEFLEANKLTKEEDDAVSAFIETLETLKKEQSELTKQRDKTAITDIKTITNINTEIEVINEKIKALKALRVEEEGFHFQKLKQLEEEKVAKIEDSTLDDTIFQKKTDLINQEILLEQEKQEFLQDSITQHLAGIQNLTNVFTDNKLKKLNDASRAELAIINERERDGLITEQEADQARRKLEEDSDKKAEAIEKKAFNRNKAFNLASAIIETSLSVTRALANPPGVPFTIPFGVTAGALGAVQVASIAAQRFAQGGIIQGNSHANGGVPIMGGTAEVEGSEIILTKGVTANPSLRAAANQLNILGGGQSFLQNGGVLSNNFPTFALPESGAGQDLASIVDAIAELKIQVDVNEISGAQNNVAIAETQASI